MISDLCSAVLAMLGQATRCVSHWAHADCLTHPYFANIAASSSSRVSSTFFCDHLRKRRCPDFRI